MKMNHALNLAPFLFSLLFSIHSAHAAEKWGLGCSAWLESQCDALYSSQNNGEMDVSIDGKTLHLGLGNDAKTSLETAYLKSLQAVTDSLDKMPQDYVKNLRKFHALGDLKKYLHYKEPTDLDFKKYEKELSVAHKTGDAMGLAFKATADERFNALFPNYNRKKHMPVEMQINQSEVSNKLTYEISLAKWQGSEAWKETEKEFKTVRDTYLDLVTHDPDKSIPESMRKQWLDDLNTVKLIIPRSKGWTLENCKSDMEMNAAYDPNENEFTVCAGLFNSQGLNFVISHELGHLLGIGRATVMKERTTKAFQQLMGLRKDMCEKRLISACSPEWTAFKTALNQNLNEFDHFDVPKPKLRECLITKQVQPYDESQLKTEAQHTMLKWIDQTATSFGFTSQMVPTLPDDYKGDVADVENPTYFNPCFPDNATDVRRADLLNGNSVMLYFLNEYLCQDPSLDEATKLNNATNIAGQVYVAITTKEVPLGGKFSESQLMGEFGFSEDVDEKYADFMAGKVMKTLLKQQFSKASDRRAKLFYDTALFCTKKDSSISTKYPDKAKAEKTLTTEPHPLDLERRQRIFGNPEFRDILECDQDFNFPECSET